MNNTIEQAAPGIWLTSGSMVLMPPNPRIIAPSLVPFWLDAFVLKGIKVRAIGLATTSMTMRVMLNGVELAMRIQNRPVKTVTKPTVPELLTWATNLEHVA